MKQSIFNPDRRITYLLLLIVMIFPLVNPLGIAIKPSGNALLAYDYAETLPEGSSVILIVDYSMGFTAEMAPQALALLKHYDSLNFKLFAATQVPEMATALSQMLEDTYGASEKVYGTDYVDLGYFAGTESAVGAMGDSIIDVFKTDIHGTSLTTLPIFQDVVKLPDIDLMYAATSSGTIPFIRQAHTKFGMPIVFSVNAVMGPANVPYVQSGQAVSVLVGSTGAAEYETLIQSPGAASAAMDAQSLAHLVIILMIVWGNIGFFVERKREKDKKVQEV
ncbi:MAG: hypothetical protein GX138_04540 [Firmicutes bacterium]|jgi:hypothetical protein|nr:hypothetical protein [Bacillota bacterium]